MPEYTVSAPASWPGTPEEAGRNFRTHRFVAGFDGDIRCAECDCRPGGRVAEWPCGASVPRVTVEAAHTLSTPIGPVFVYEDQLRPREQTPRA